MEISDNIEIIDLFLYIKDIKAIVIGDTHFGYEESLNKQGILVPKFQTQEIFKRIEKVLKEKKPDKAIVVGDLKHEFGNITNEEWRDTLKFIDLLRKHTTPVLIKGNHDKLLEPIVKKRNLDLKRFYKEGRYLFCHGHELIDVSDDEDVHTVIIGHVHPAIGLKDNIRVEVYKCFLKGKFQDKELIVLPSVSSMPEGTDIMKEKLNSPFIKNPGNFEVFVVEDKAYDFGVLRNIMKRN